MTSDEVVLYDYWRSSASYRVRIALNLAGVAHRTVPVDLLSNAHKSVEHLARNPQGLVPALSIDGLLLTQSLAIIEYLDETRGAAQLMPRGAAARARVRALSYAIAMEIHPICNSSVAAHVAKLTGGEEGRTAWLRKYIGEGLAAVEAMLGRPGSGRFCHDDRPTMADCCLVPQLYNADRWGVDTSDLHRIHAIAAACAGLDAFAAAHPDSVKPPEA